MARSRTAAPKSSSRTGRDVAVSDSRRGTAAASNIHVPSPCRCFSARERAPISLWAALTSTPLDTRATTVKLWAVREVCGGLSSRAVQKSLPPG